MALAKKYRERLEMAASELMKWRPSKKMAFDMRTWGRQTDCGTVCCAGGYVASLPWFNRRGLTFHPGDVFGVTIRLRGTDCISRRSLAEFFGLDSHGEQFHDFFDDYSVTRPQEIARRIRAFLKADAKAAA